MQSLLGLFLTFFKLGAFTFGGGYAMISLIENEVVTRKGWLSREEMLDIITIAESTPGPLAVNMATFVGTKIKGILGAIVATLGLVIPPFTIICIISLVLNEFKEIAVIAYALKGIQAGVVVLILNAFLKFFKGMDKSIMSYIFLIVTFVIALATDFPVVAIIVIGAVLGVSITAISTHIANKKVRDTANVDSVDTDKNAPLDTLAGGIVGDEPHSESAESVEDASAEGASCSQDIADNPVENSDISAQNIDENSGNITDNDKISDNDAVDTVDSPCVETSDDESKFDNGDTYSIVQDVDDKEGSDI